MDIRDSSAYWAILDEGLEEERREEAQRIILRQGRQKFGSPSDAIVAASTDLERLHRIQDRIFTASTWDELLATP